MAWRMTNTIHSLALIHDCPWVNTISYIRNATSQHIKTTTKIIFIVHANCQNIFICLRIAISYAQTNAHTITLFTISPNRKNSMCFVLSKCSCYNCCTAVLFVCFDFFYPRSICRFHVFWFEIIFFAMKLSAKTVQQFLFRCNRSKGTKNTHTFIVLTNKKEII